MKTGTKSVLFGVHAFWWHPITVLLAWVELNGIPSWKQLMCIWIHDIGYWGKPDMDGKEGELHPLWAANFAHTYLDKSAVQDHKNWYYNFCLYHSRTMADINKVTPSALCWADKLSIKYDPWWFYIIRALLSGEIWEYRKAAIDLGGILPNATHHEWFNWARHRGMIAGYNKNSAKAYDKVI